MRLPTFVFEFPEPLPGTPSEPSEEDAENGAGVLFLSIKLGAMYFNSPAKEIINGSYSGRGADRKNCQSCLLTSIPSKKKSSLVMFGLHEEDWYLCQEPGQSGDSR